MFIGFDALLIDMDGTLVDSSAVVIDTWTKFSERHGLDARQVLGQVRGVRIADMTRHFLGDTEEARLECERITRTYTEATHGIHATPGAGALLKTFPSDIWALVTSASRELATRRMEIAGLPLPDVMICAENVSQGKPDPTCYKLAAERLDAPAASCIVIEDSDAGIRAGLAAGAAAVVDVGGKLGLHAPQLIHVKSLAELVLETSGHDRQLKINTPTDAL